MASAAECCGCGVPLTAKGCKPVNIDGELYCSTQCHQISAGGAAAAAPLNPVTDRKLVLERNPVMRALHVESLKGDTSAMCDLGVMYLTGDIDMDSDPDEAFRLFKRSAEDKVAKAQFYLGVCYEEGVGVEQDAAEAAKWFKLASDQNFAGAHHSLAMCYMHGTGVGKDPAKARSLLKLGADGRDSEAMRVLAEQYVADLPSAALNAKKLKLDESFPDVCAFKLFECAAAHGHAEAQYEYGRCLLRGIGTKRDATAAEAMLVQAANAGVASAACLYCNHVVFGLDAKDSRAGQAVAMLRAAADRGDAGAQYLYGVLLAQGRGGVTQNSVEAANMYMLAAEQGNLDAMSNLALCYSTGDGVAQNDAAMLGLLWNSANRGNRQSLANLGVCFAFGIGDLRSPTVGVRFLREAASKGSAMALYYLGVCYLSGRGVQLDKATGFAYKRSARQAAQREGLRRTNDAGGGWDSDDEEIVSDSDTILRNQKRQDGL
jgi:TPR repeat protein